VCGAQIGAEIKEKNEEKEKEKEAVSDEDSFPALLSYARGLSLNKETKRGLFLNIRVVVCSTKHKYSSSKAAVKQQQSSSKAAVKQQ
jgi:hypothetical protein